MCGCQREHCSDGKVDVETYTMNKALEWNRHVKKFKQILLEAVDGELTSLDENAKKSVYFHLNQQFKIIRQEMFQQLLEQIFDSGARQLETLFMKSLNPKVGGL